MSDRQPLVWHELDEPSARLVRDDEMWTFEGQIVPNVGLERGDRG